MKYSLVMSLFSGLIFFAMPACNKKDSKSSSSTKPNLTLSQSTVARGQQLNISVANLPPTATVKWTVYPTRGTSVFASRDQAEAFFGSAGNYTVTANFYVDSTTTISYDSSSTPVTVSDSIYTPPPPVQSDTSALAGDQIQIQPITATDTGGLMLVAQTVNLYSCAPHLNYYFEYLDSSFSLYCLSVSTNPALCNGIQSTAKAVILNPAPANGVYQFNVILNTAIYRGTLTVTDNNYTFNWPYSSAVTISPQQIASK